MLKTTLSTDIKSQNRQLIYHYIRSHEPVSKQDLVIGLGLSLPTVTQNLQFLEKAGLIGRSKERKNTGGRNAATYSHNKNGKQALGVYLTGNHINVVCVNLSGDVIEAKRERVPFRLEDDGYLQKIGRLVEEVKEQAVVSKETFLGVGIAVPSLVSDDGEEVIYGLTLNFTGKTRAEIAKYIPYPTRMYHDSFAAGFAEVWIRSSVQSAVYISLNNSVGGSIIIDKHIYGGTNNRSGEIGHILVQPKDGKTCYCGKRGCFDTLCNAGILDSLTDGNLGEFFRLLKEENPQAKLLWETYLEHLSLAVHNIRMLFDCPIILGGYVGAYLEDFMEELYERVDKKNCFGDPAREYVFPCQYKVESTAAGAALQLIEEFIKAL